jgi:hypothetical protein
LSQIGDSMRAHAALDSDAQTAVRRYLEYVENPSSAIDQELVKELREQLSDASDVLSRVRLLSQLERAQQADGATLLQAFVQHALPWATANSVTATAFQSMGVSSVVLAEAGFDLGHGSVADRAKASAALSRKGATDRPRQRRAPSQPIARAVPSATIEAWMLQTSGPFTLLDAMRAVGGSPMTVRKVADRLTERAVLRSLGQISIPGARGRAPQQFERIAHG